MTKSELKPGYVVRYRSGELRMVMPLEDKYVLVEMDDINPAWCNLQDFDDDLTVKNCPSCDIMEVYGYSNRKNYVWTFNKDTRKLLWKRPEKKKYTYAQLREILGEEFEVVG